MCRGCSLQGGSEGEPESQAPSGAGKTSGRGRRSTGPRRGVTPPPPDAEMRGEMLRASHRGHRGQAGESAPADKTQPTKEAEFDSGSEDVADSARAHGALGANETVTPGEQDNGVNETNEKGDQKQ